MMQPFALTLGLLFFLVPLLVPTSTEAALGCPLLCRLLLMPAIGVNQGSKQMPETWL
jgi:hypothetical protein